MTDLPEENGDTRYVYNSQKLYLDLLTRSLLGLIYEDPPIARFGNDVFNLEHRLQGLDWPTRAFTMVGLKRLMNARQLAETVIFENVPGDFLEAGVWRGGVGIMLRGVLSAYNISNRRLWLADSFEGLPPPNAADYPLDSASEFHTYPELSVTMDQVKENFRKYDLLDDRVVFAKGWFKDTLPQAAIEKIALLRLDGDLYESTMQGLVSLYDKVSPNGYIIIDDYHCVPQCAQAVEDFCAKRNISPALHEIDGVGVYWQKLSDASPASNEAPGGEDERMPTDRNVMCRDAHYVKINAVLNKRYLQLAEREAMIAERDTRLQEKEALIMEKETELTAAAAVQAEYEGQLAERDTRLAELKALLGQRDVRIQELRETVEAMEYSRSWQVTAPLRYFSGLLFGKKTQK